MVISWLTVLESHPKAIRPNLAKSSGWRMTPIGDNQLAHLVTKTCSQCNILAMFYLESILWVQESDLGPHIYIYTVFSNLRHLQKHSPSITAAINKQSKGTEQCVPSPETEASSVYQSEMQIALSRDRVINEEIQGKKKSTHPLGKNAEIEYMPKGIYYYNIHSQFDDVWILIYESCCTLRSVNIA